MRQGMIRPNATHTGAIRWMGGLSRSPQALAPKPKSPYPSVELRCSPPPPGPTNTPNIGCAIRRASFVLDRRRAADRIVRPISLDSTTTGSPKERERDGGGGPGPKGGRAHELIRRASWLLLLRMGVDNGPTTASPTKCELGSTERSRVVGLRGARGPGARLFFPSFINAGWRPSIHTPIDLTLVFLIRCNHTTQPCTADPLPLDGKPAGSPTGGGSGSSPASYVVVVVDWIVSKRGTSVCLCMHRHMHPGARATRGFTHTDLTPSPASQIRARLRSSRKWQASMSVSSSGSSNCSSSSSSSCSSSSSSGGGSCGGERGAGRDMDASTTEFMESGLAGHREKSGVAGAVAGGKGAAGGQGQHHMLGEWTATALCGNDVMR